MACLVCVALYCVCVLNLCLTDESSLLLFSSLVSAFPRHALWRRNNNINILQIFDPTTSSGLGLLQEMSLVELRERLRMVHAMQEEEVVEKRKSIMRLKQQKFIIG